MNLDLRITEKQNLFMESEAFETLFGGAAGGGKSYGQLIDALVYALKYEKSKQIIFRRTFPDLERSIIRTSLELYPREIASYNSSKHVWTFQNGSIIDFGYIDNENDVYQYMSSEYDVIRFDELTHFTEYMYVYMISRCRGANGYPKRIKSSTNPGNIGHVWVKERFIDIGPYGEVHKVRLESGEETTRLFIPSFVTENKFLMEKDPDYVKRLDALPEKERRALKEGNWDIFDGQYFKDFDRSVNVIEPFEIPDNWDRYRTLDYGLDMLACYWIAIDPQGYEYVYKELYESDLIISEAAAKILELNGDDKVRITYAPPDLWNRRQDTGRNAYDIFRENGIILTKTSNNRVLGWYSVQEHLKIETLKDEQTGEEIKRSKLRFFNTCKNILRTLPVIQRDEKNPNDCAKEPHELTHGPDAIRGFCIERTKATRIMSEDELLYEQSKRERRRLGILGIAGATATRDYMRYGG